jgi:hypothetical protein
MTVRTKKEFCRRNKISERHLERLRARGEGPAVIQIGVRQYRIDDEDEAVWHRSRRRAPPRFKQDETVEKTKA